MFSATARRVTRVYDRAAMEPPDHTEDETAVAPAASAAPSAPGKAGVIPRLLGVLGALVLAFLAAVAIIAMLDIADLTTCHDANRDPSFSGTDCFDGSSKRQLLTLLLGFPGSALAAVAVVLALAFAVRGRGLKPLGIAIAAGAVLFGLALLVGSTG